MARGMTVMAPDSPADKPRSVPFGARAFPPNPCLTRLARTRREVATVSVKMRTTWPSSFPSKARGKRRGKASARRTASEVHRAGYDPRDSTPQSISCRREVFSNIGPHNPTTSTIRFGRIGTSTYRAFKKSCAGHPSHGRDGGRLRRHLRPKHEGGCRAHEAPAGFHPQCEEPQVGDRLNWLAQHLIPGPGKRGA